MESEVKTSHDSETLAQGQQVLTACGFIYRNTACGIELFLPKRAKTKKFLPSVYELPGGHIDFGEGMKDGLKREIQEELGMEIIIGDCFEVFTYVNEIKGSHSLEAIFFAQFIGDHKNIELNPEDHESYVWITEEKICDITSSKKGEDDDEIQVIKKGFSILNGDFNWKIT